MKIAPALLLALVAVPAAATPPDARFANAKTVYIEPLDPLEGDRPVAACIAEHLPAALPLTIAATKEEADIVLRVKARISGDTMRQLMAVLGSIQLWAMAPDGTQFWSGKTSEDRANATTLPPDKADVPCLLADAGINMLRNALKKARKNSSK